MDITVRNSIAPDISFLAENIRREDAEEIFAHSGETPLAALEHGYSASINPKTGLLDGEPFCMFGSAAFPNAVAKGNLSWSNREIGGHLGFVWLLGTPRIKECKMGFLKRSIRWVEYLHTVAGCKTLMNFVDARNALHIEWLKWLGFSIVKKHETFGYSQIPFYEFYRTQDTRCFQSESVKLDISHKKERG